MSFPRAQQGLILLASLSRPTTLVSASRLRVAITASDAVVGLGFADRARSVAVFDDRSATVEGTVAARSFRLRMPYHASGTAAEARVCIRSVNATGQQSGVSRAARCRFPPAGLGARPAMPPPPSEPVLDWG